MSKKLLESDFLTVNLRSLFNDAQNNDTQVKTEPAATTTDKANQANTDRWKEELVKLGFSNEIIEKLDVLGEPFKKALRVLGYNIDKENGGNPILAFIYTDFGKSLLLNNKLNASTFKVIFNAVAKKLVADSEFFTENAYNIIYCLDLYNKAPAEMEKYLELQSNENLLKVSAEEYSVSLQTKNKLVFLHTDKVNELNPEKRAEQIKKDTDNLTKIYADIKNVRNATLNSLDLAKLINGANKVPTTSLSPEKQSELAKKLTKKSDIYAALLLLSATTDSASAKEALNKVSDVQPKDALEAFVRLISNDVMPKGQLNTSDTDALVDKLLAGLQQ